MFPAKYLIASLVVGIVAFAGPTAVQSNRSAEASHGVSLYWDGPYGRTYRNVDGANNGSGFVVGVVEVPPYQQALVAYRRRNPGFTMPEPVDYTGISVASNTSEFLAMGSFSPVRFANSVVLRYGQNPLNRTLVASGNDESAFTAVSDPDGNRIEIFSATTISRIASITRDGVTRWSYTARWDTDQLAFYTIALDTAGNTVAEGLAFRDTVFFGRNIQQGAFLFKVSPSGEVVWLRHVMDAGYIPSIRTAGDGTIVFIALPTAAFTWAGQTLEPTPDAPEFLLAAGPDGSDLWALHLENSSTRFLLSVHQAGQIAIAGGNTGCNGTFVRNFDLAGNLLWERVFDPQGCDGQVRAMGLTFSDDDLVVTGDMRGTVDLGFGPFTFPDQQAFYLGLSM
jgi:hypothetical protein